MDTLLKEIQKQDASVKGMTAADRSMRVLKRTWPLWKNWH